MSLSRRGFSLLEILIVVVIVALLVGGASQYYADLREEARFAKARLDCSMLVQACIRFEQSEGAVIASLGELKGTCVSDIDRLRDPWNHPYEIDPVLGVVFSRGPDGRKDGAREAGNSWFTCTRDDIRSPYTSGLMLKSARIEKVAGDARTTVDCSVLRLTFNKPVRVAGDIVLAETNATGEAVAAAPDPSRIDAACPRYGLRWYLDSPSNPVDCAVRPLYKDRKTGADACPTWYFTPWSWSGGLKRSELGEVRRARGLAGLEFGHAGLIFRGAPGEIVIAAPNGFGVENKADGTTDGIVAGRHLLNLTGTRRNCEAGAGNPLFRTETGETSAQMSPVPVRIEADEETMALR